MNPVFIENRRRSILSQFSSTLKLRLNASPTSRGKRVEDPKRTPPRTINSLSPDLKIEDQCQLQPTTTMVDAIERTIHILHPQHQALYFIGICGVVDLVERQHATPRDHARLARLSCPRRPCHSVPIFSVNINSKALKESICKIIRIHAE